ncbi:serine hydrolase domain-containing protein [Candidatus Latescibacterota bacterium]
MVAISRFLIPLLSFLWITSTVLCQGLPSAVPEDVGLSSERLNRISKVLQEFVDQKKISGMVTLVARHGKVAHLEAFGMKDIEAGEQMRVDTMFRIASMTKPVTAVAAMILYEEGHFLLSDPISRYIPEFKNPRVLVPSSPGDVSSRAYTIVPAKSEITILNLLNHTSGLTYGAGYLGEFYRDAGISNGLSSTEGTIGDMVKKLAKLPLYHHPGEDATYGLSLDVLGYIVEIVSGIPLDRFFHERIFNPLDMNDTYFYPPEDKLHRVAALYARNEKGGIDSQQERKIPSVLLGPRTYFAGGGGLVSTISDYARFAQMLLNGGELDGVRLLSRKTVELMTTNSLGELYILKDYNDTRATHGDKYGLGLGIRTERGDIESIGTFGWGGAFHTLFWVDPKEDMVGIFMSQLQASGNLYQHKKFRILAYQAIVD